MGDGMEDKHALLVIGALLASAIATPGNAQERLTIASSVFDRAAVPLNVKLYLPKGTARSRS